MTPHQSRKCSRTLLGKVSELMLLMSVAHTATRCHYKPAAHTGLTSCSEQSRHVNITLNEVLLEKLIATQMVKKFHAFYGT